MYLGILGGHKCAEYRVYLSRRSTNATAPGYTPCDEAAGLGAALVKQAQGGSTGITALTHDIFSYGSCAANGYVDFKLHIDEADTTNNLVFEIEDLSDSYDPSALDVYLYGTSLPANRGAADALITISESYNGLYTMQYNYIKLKYSPTRDYFVSVRCGSGTDRKFRVLAVFVKSSLEVAVHAHGEACSNAWLYHVLYPHGDARSAAPSSSSSSSSSHHRRHLQRRRQLMSQGRGGIDDQTMAATVEQQRRLGAAYSTTGKHVRFTVQVFDGKLYMLSTRKNYPPSFASQNDDEMLVQSEAQSQNASLLIKQYQVESCNAEAVPTYVGLFAEAGCVAYDLIAERFDGPCQTSRVSIFKVY